MTVYFGDGTNQTTAGISSGSAGKVNKVTTMYSTNTATRAGALSHMTAFNINVTPVAAASRIILAYSFSHGISGSWYGIGSVVYRDSTKVADAGSGSRVGMHSGPNFAGVAGGMQGSAHYTLVDHPNTTSQVTYKFYAGASDGDGTIYIGRTEDDSDNTEHQRIPFHVVAYDVTL